MIYIYNIYTIYIYIYIIYIYISAVDRHRVMILVSIPTYL